MNYRSSYAGDPRKITARRPGTCAKCGKPFLAGERIFYYPKGKQTYSGECALAAERDFEAARSDEDAMSGGFA
jgi:hypothetical protein